MKNMDMIVNKLGYMISGQQEKRMATNTVEGGGKTVHSQDHPHGHQP